MFPDFQSFKEEISWFIQSDDEVSINNGFITTNTAFAITFPILNSLIQRARVLDIKINESVYKLFSWTTYDGLSCGWLCQYEHAAVSNLDILPEHQLLLDNIGGINESYNQPDGSFTNNQNFLFIKSMCEQGIGDWDIHYRMCREDGEFNDFSDQHLVSFAHEANGALTLYDRVSKRIYLYSHDHSFNYVTSVQGQPRLTYHTINGVDSFIDYVEAVALQWTRHVQIN